MSKILVLCWHPGTTTIATAGGFKRLLEILKLKQINDQIILIDKFPNLYSEADGITLIEYKKSPIIGGSKVVDRFWTLFCLIYLGIKYKNTYDKIYVPFSEIPQITLAGVILKFIYNKRLILCNLNINTLKIDNLINRRIHKYADKIITISTALKLDLQNNKIFPTYVNGVGFDRVTKVNKQKKIYDAIFIGRHTKEKGIYDLVRIWDILKEKFGKNYKLATIGDVIDPISISKKLNIKLLGNLKDEKKLETIMASKICVFPSYQEGWGIVPMECLSLGVPVIAYDLPVYKESIGNTPAFKKVKIGDLLSYSTQIIDLIERYGEFRDIALKWRPVINWHDVAAKEWQIINSN